MLKAKFHSYTAMYLLDFWWFVCSDYFSPAPQHGRSSQHRSPWFSESWDLMNAECPDWILYKLRCDNFEVLWNQLPWLARAVHAAAGRVPWPLRWMILGRSVNDGFGVKKNTKKWSFCRNPAFLLAVKICVELQTAASSCISAMRDPSPPHSLPLFFCTLRQAKNSLLLALQKSQRNVSDILWEGPFSLDRRK